LTVAEVSIVCQRKTCTLKSHAIIVCQRDTCTLKSHDIIVCQRDTCTLKSHDIIVQQEWFVPSQASQVAFNGRFSVYTVSQVPQLHLHLKMPIQAENHSFHWVSHDGKRWGVNNDRDTGILRVSLDKTNLVMSLFLIIVYVAMCIVTMQW